MLLVTRFYPKLLTYSILWTIPTGALWGEVSQGHNDMLTAEGIEPEPNTYAQTTVPHASYRQHEAFTPEGTDNNKHPTTTPGQR